MLFQISKRIKAFLLLSVTLLLAGCQGDGNLYGYDFQSARITYQVTGSSVGSSEVLIKGEKKVIKNNIVQTRPDGTKFAVNTYIIQDGDKQYTLDPVAKKGSLIINPLYAELQSMDSQQRKEKLIRETVRATEDQNPKPEAQEDIAGQKCNVYSGTMTKTCLWQAIPLKTVASLPDYGIQTETIATKIELNQSISDSEFDVPSDYQITELK